MMGAEMVPYTETRRDELEQELAQEANKRILNERFNHGIRVIAYWLVAENVCTIFVHDARTNSAAEFSVPNEEVMEWFNHPYANPAAIVPRYEQRSNDE